MLKAGVSAEFQVFGNDEKWGSVRFNIIDANFAPPHPRIVDLIVRTSKGEQALTYLDESRARGQADVTCQKGKFLGPLLRRNINFQHVEPIISGAVNDGITVNLYPFSENYESYGVWALLEVLGG